MMCGISAFHLIFFSASNLESNVICEEDNEL